MQTFKKGDRLICINDENSSNMLVKGQTYIVQEFIHHSGSNFTVERKYVLLEGVDLQSYTYRFINIKELRKQKLEKLKNV